MMILNSRDLLLGALAHACAGAPTSRKSLCKIADDVFRSSRVQVFAQMAWSTETKTLMQISYRKLKCANCKRILDPGEFHHKVKGLEGPIKKYWGKKDSFCKKCRLSRKTKEYKKKKLQIKNNSVRRVSSNTLDVLNYTVVVRSVPDSCSRRDEGYSFLIETILKGDI